MSRIISILRNLAVAAPILLCAITTQAQALIPAVGTDSLVAESTPFMILPDAPESEPTSAAFVLTPPAPRLERPKPAIGTRALGLFAWPGYGMMGKPADDAQNASRVLMVAERAASIFDGATTYVMLDTPFLPDAIKATEGDPLLKAFGNRSKVGVLASGAALELLVSCSSVAIPRFVERRFGNGAGEAASIGTFLLNGALTLVHVELGVYNLKNTATLMQSVKAVNGK